MIPGLIPVVLNAVRSSRAPTQGNYAMSKTILTAPLPSTPTLDRLIAQQAKAMARVDQDMAKANAVIDKAFSKANLVMRKSIVALAAVMLALTAGLASAQTQRTDTCVNGIADTYRFRVPSFTQHEIRVTANRNNPGIFFLIFDSDSLRGVAHSNSRSLHWSAGLLSGRHEVWVGCLRTASYTIQWVNGNERRLSPPRYVSYLTGADLSAKSSLRGVETDTRKERILQWAHARHLAAEQAQQTEQ